MLHLYGAPSSVCSWSKAILLFMIVLLTWTTNISDAQVNSFLDNPDPSIFKSASKKGMVIFHDDFTIPFDKLFDEMGEWFGVVDPYTMKIKKVMTDTKGQLHYRYQQYYKDIPVHGAQFMLHTHVDGQRSGNGKIMTPLNIHETIKLNEEEALNMLLSNIGAKKYYWQDSAREARVKLKRNNPAATYYPSAKLEFLPDDIQTSMNLCYTYDVYCLENGASGKYYVDVATGQILKLRKAEHSCENFTFASNYNGFRIAKSVDTGDEYELVDDCEDAVYTIYDELNNSEVFTDPNNDWDTDFKQSAATSQWALRRAYDAYLGKFNRSGHDDDDGNLDVYQAYYFEENGGNYNASYSYDPFGNDEIRVGIGDFGYVTDDYNTLDIIGHEFTHGVDEYTSELEYEGESGALDESFADIFGEWIEYYTINSCDWFHGAEKLDADGCPTPNRYFVNPAATDVYTTPDCFRNFSQPNTYLGTNWYPVVNCDPGSENDHCGVHRNSGVQNQMFYLLSEGGSGWNDGNTCHAPNGSGFQWEVSGIGIDDAIEIAYLAHVGFLVSDSDYEDSRDAWVAAASVLFGSCSEQAIQAGKAWHAVGLPPPTLVDYVLCNEFYGSGNSTVLYPGAIRTNENCVVIVSNNGGTTAFKAGSHIQLKPGFHAQFGSDFTGEITDCIFASY